jgi:hypothetical protein
MAGDSPGYSLSLVAETTTGVLLSVERTPAARAPAAQGQGQAQGQAQNWAGEARWTTACGAHCAVRS